MSRSCSNGAPRKPLPLTVRVDENNTITLSRREKLALWKALREPVKLTPNQKKLGALMRGEPWPSAT